MSASTIKSHFDFLMPSTSSKIGTILWFRKKRSFKNTRLFAAFRQPKAREQCKFGINDLETPLKFDDFDKGLKKGKSLNFEIKKCYYKFRNFLEHISNLPSKNAKSSGCLWSHPGARNTMHPGRHVRQKPSVCTHASGALKKCLSDLETRVFEVNREGQDMMRLFDQFSQVGNDIESRLEMLQWLTSKVDKDLQSDLEEIKLNYKVSRRMTKRDCKAIHIERFNVGMQRAVDSLDLNKEFVDQLPFIQTGLSSDLNYLKFLLDNSEKISVRERKISRQIELLEAVLTDGDSLTHLEQIKSHLGLNSVSMTYGCKSWTDKGKLQTSIAHMCELRKQYKNILGSLKVCDSYCREVDKKVQKMKAGRRAQEKAAK